MCNWDQLKADHGEAIWAIIFRIVRNESDASDCYQDVFLEAFRKSASSQVRNLPGLLRWLAVRRAMDLIRSHNTSSGTRSLQHEVDKATHTEVGRELEFSELVDRVRRELACIPAQQGEAFWICCIEEMSYKEAAQLMNVSTNHVGVLVSRARKHLQVKLETWNQHSTAADTHTPITHIGEPES